MINNKKWMSNISDKTKLVNVNIPGTHDSGTFGTVVAFTKTQDWSIEKQLKNGIRFLDIRLSKIISAGTIKPITTIPPQYILMHGPAPVGGNFLEDIYTPIFRFLENNPSEMIFMSIKSENSIFTIDHEDMKYFLKLDKFYDQPKKIEDVELQDVRGKVVLLNRVTENEGYSWNKLNIQDKYELEMGYYQQVIVPGVKERTQKICYPTFSGLKCYEQVIIPEVKERTQSVPNGWKYEKKTEHISNFIKSNHTNPSNKLNINFLTASSSNPQFYVPFTNGVSTNSRIQNSYIVRKNWSANGMIFPMDYPVNECINKIIESNN
ncbi:hypothetical protein G1K75_00285 [Tenacibaculum finnmarkense]|uniref:hypothetical protein n=1 Tax=Tenacibaculum finnmarkense TaxID=2781243 RepID=UPI001EFA7C90|nr:hypothetical protein [Tenacibaculum finnmarkense]MCG8804103.1 hypothetical protein [Tenacibaculum finnmarkense]MCG8856157.1 hypothetical protein [Tenacibaculum finnmarkense]